MPTWLQVIFGIIGEAETVIPIFIHNPKSQQIEGIIVTAGNGLLTQLASTFQKTTQAVVAKAAAPNPTPASPEASAPSVSESTGIVEAGQAQAQG